MWDFLQRLLLSPSGSKCLSASFDVSLEPDHRRSWWWWWEEEEGRVLVSISLPPAAETKRSGGLSTRVSEGITETPIRGQRLLARRMSDK
jgi:hypothetical protein